jgi:phosphatidylserine/phosphatidylglycerophosphate/cardiolipin synthase-like enzyme
VVELIRVHARGVLWFVAAALLAAVAACSGPPSAATETSPSAKPASPALEVCFTPPPGCTNVVVKALGAAQTSVLVQAYTFTSASIAKALLDANHRGVKVEVILDKSQRSAQYSSADFLARADIPVKIDAAHAIAHNKVMIIDGVTVLTGSFNFTRAADQKNAENLLVIHDAALADRYAKNWHTHAQHSEAYTAK